MGVPGDQTGGYRAGNDIAPRAVPPERLAALRTAFDATMKDPEFRAEAARQRLAVTPMSGTEATDFIRAGAEALGVGSELVSPSALLSGNLQEISTAAQRYLEIVREARSPVLALAREARG